MPIYKFGEKLIYFSHVPKAGGTTIERYLGELADHEMMKSTDRRVFRGRQSILNLPPQHITAQQAEDLFSCGAFHGIFVMVRDPVERMISEYRFRKPWGGIHGQLSFPRWVRTMLPASRKEPYLLDGHFIPQTEFLVEGASVFRLENGTEPLRAWLSERLEREMPDFPERLNASQAPRPELDDGTRAFIANHYRQDYERFGYPFPEVGAARDPSLRDRLVGLAYRSHHLMEKGRR